MKKLFLSTVAAYLLLASLAGCTAEAPLLPNEAENDDGLCTFTLSTGSNVSVETRALTDMAIDEVWVVQISADGTKALVEPQHVVPNASKKIKVRLASSQCKIYFFVNTGNDKLFDPTAELTSITTSTMKGVQMSHSGNWIERSNIPMFGTWEGTPQYPTTSGAVELTSALAQLKVKITGGTSLGTDFYVESIQLKNVPNRLFMLPSAGDCPAIAGTTFAPYPLISTSVPLGSVEATFFMPENCRGIGSERYQTEKNGTLLSGGEQHATYIEIVGKKGQNSSARLRYRFFFGANNTNDYNVKRNYIYTTNIVIAGTNPSDLRVTIDGTSTVNSGATIDSNWPSTPSGAGNGDLALNS